MEWSTSSAGTPQEKHDVFLSFRGEDTRYTFTGHLHATLTRLQVNTYIDYNLQRGEEISSSLLKAIEDAKLSVVVFSKNYGNSKWCLDELVKILECRKMRGQIVLPVFYDVDPSHVRNQTGTYAEAFAKHEELLQGQMEKLQKWREALREAANYSGWDCSVNRMESELIEKIANDVLEKLNRVYVGDLDQQIAKLEQLAKLQHQFYKKICSVENLKKHRATVERLTELKMERSVRMLRLSPDMLSHLENSKDTDNYLDL
ncbi:toll/interleukin-1 receptor-like protein [Cajanus cajan]|uniref:TMV resistance protein N n=1 Tax=Cajanus cajan TaxID=3821 RepID=A0A151TFY2_CAJCA|nr:toll/interleukin-1 receptor-like protein [Cajanus cajan]KYP65964.1 TMV resistance protein N [Cajanus cajan]